MNVKHEREYAGLRRSGFLPLMLVSMAVATLSGCASTAYGSGKKPPNIILMMADDISAKEFGCYGNTEHKTPVLDQLAETGVCFKTCWATPICSPSRAMIMTGRYGFRTEWFHNQMKPRPPKKGSNLGTSHIIFAEALNTAGYATAICGKWQLVGTEADYGFDEYCMWRKHENFDGPIEQEGHQLPGRAARYWHPAIVKNGQPLPTTDKDYGPDIFVDFLLDFAKRKKNEPFLIYYPMCLPHLSWDFEAQRDGYLPVPELDADGNKTGRKVPGSLKSNVEYMDKLVARIVRGLKTLGIRDNTVLLFTGDNGTAVYGKCKFDQERGPRVAMIANGPGIVKPLGAVDALIDFSDVLPTLCELAGAKLPDDYVIDGRSFAPILRGDNSRQREWIFTNYADRRLLRDQRWLLDGNDHLWDCGNRRNEKGYKNVTNSKIPQVIAARQRFEKILERLPAPSEQQRKSLTKNARFLKLLPPKKKQKGS